MVKGVNICDVKVLNNPALFLDPFKFEITFACHENLPDDIEWKITYVGSAESEKYDQDLDSVLVGPVPAGKHMFTLEVPGPDASKIPDQDVVGVTIVLITCSYREKEFIRVGYYVSNSYKDLELHENPPEKPKFDLLERNVLSTDPRVTRFNIDWGDSQSAVHLLAPSAEGESTSHEQQQASMETDFEIQNKENKNLPKGLGLPAMASKPAEQATSSNTNLDTDSTSKKAVEEKDKSSTTDQVTTHSEPMQIVN